MNFVEAKELHAITLDGGVLFGPVWCVLYNFNGATVCAVLSFLIARYVASDWVLQKSEAFKTAY